MFSKPKKKRQDKDFEIAAYKYGIPEEIAKRVCKHIPLSQVEEIAHHKLEKLKNDFIASESEVAKAKVQTETNQKFIDAKEEHARTSEKVKLFKSALSQTIKPYQMANELRMFFIQAKENTK